MKASTGCVEWPMVKNAMACRCNDYAVRAARRLQPAPDMDITQLILDDHHEQRRLFAILDEIEPADTRILEAIWARLSAFLEIHAEAEERIFYPALLRVGEGAGGKADAVDETEHAIRDHNKIRSAVMAGLRYSLGRPPGVSAGAPRGQKKEGPTGGGKNG